MCMPHSATLALVAGSALAAAALAHSGRHSPKEPQHFTVNKLLAPVLQRLPVGGVIPAGWLKDELALQAKGISGQLPYFWHYLNSTEWLSPDKDPYGRAGGS